MAPVFVRRTSCWLMLGGLAPLICSGCGGDVATPVTPVPIPASPTAPVARLNVHIDDAGSTGAILGFTPIRFDASSSTADTPKYLIEFGDGKVSTEPVAVHRCEKFDVLTARLTVTDRSGQSSSTTSRFACVSFVHGEGHESFDLQYGWTNILYFEPGHNDLRRLAFDLHAGSTFSGFYTHPEGHKTHFTGTLSGEHSIRIVLDDGTIEFIGDVVLKDESGEKSYFSNRHIVVVAHGGSAHGKTLDFEYFDPF